MLVELASCLVLFVPGYWILEITGLEAANRIEKAIHSFLLSTSIMFIILYLGGISGAFLTGSYILLAILGISLLHLFLMKLIEAKDSKEYVRNIFKHYFEGDKLVLTLGFIAFTLVYVVFLAVRPILESDVVEFYLPMAREIASQNAFTYSTGYDYNVFLKPIGASVIYAWVYAISGSIMTESFRFIPLVPISMMFLLIYSIAEQVTESKYVASLSALVFLIMPFHDRVLLYGALYPDIMYYALGFIALNYSISFFKSRNLRSLILIGLSLGAGSLLKAQAIYLLLAISFFIAILCIREHRLVLFGCIILPFAILIPSIIISSSIEGSWILLASILTPGRLTILFSLALISGLSYFIVTRHANVGGALGMDSPFTSGCRSDSSTELSASGSLLRDIFDFLFRFVILMLPLILLAGLWYLTNLLRFGSIINTTPLGLPGLEWATDLLNSLSSAHETPTIGHYLIHFSFILLDPAVLGWIWLLPLVIGVYFFIRNQNLEFNALAILTIFFLVVALSQITYTIPVEGTVFYNPRDLMILSPLLIILASTGLASLVTSNEMRDWTSREFKLASALVIFFGYMSYSHSVNLWFTSSLLSNSAWAQFLLSISSFFGLSPKEMSLQISPYQRVLFPLDSVLNWGGSAIIFGFPILLLLFYRLLERYGLSIGTYLQGLAETESPLKKLRKRFQLRGSSPVTILIGLLLVSVIVGPRLEMLAVQGGLTGMADYGRSRTYNSLGDPANPPFSEVTGSVLTYKAPVGLPYYLAEADIIDLKYPANLGYFRESLTLTSPHAVVQALRLEGIDYFLFSTDTFQEIDNLLNSIFSKVILDESLAIQVASFGYWNLYALEPYILRNSIPLDSWEIDLRYTDTSYNLSVFEDEMTIGILNPSSNESRVAISSLEVPRIALRNYFRLFINLNGTSNARLHLRIFTETGTALDIINWASPNELQSATYLLDDYYEETLRGDAYLSVRSSDAQPAVVYLSEISYQRIVSITDEYAIPFAGWHIDDRFTNADYHLISNETNLLLGLNATSTDDRMTIAFENLEKLQLSDFTHLISNIHGSANALIHVRIFLGNGSAYDVFHWVQPRNETDFLIELNMDASVDLRGDVYISLMSSDGSQCLAWFEEFAFARMVQFPHND